MILTCPSCRTRYRIDEEQVAGGRALRCAHCGHSWQFPAAPLGPPPGLGAPRPEPTLEVPPRPALVPVAERSGHPALAAFVVVILLIAAAVLALYLGRHKLEAAWPPATRLYALFGGAPQPLGAGLTIGKVEPKLTPEGFIIEGEIANVSKVERKVPRLRIALRNAQAEEVQFKIIDPPKRRLLPGEVETFTTPFPHPPDAATKVVVTFARG